MSKNVYRFQFTSESIRCLRDLWFTYAQSLNMIGWVVAEQSMYIVARIPHRIVYTYISYFFSTHLEFIWTLWSPEHIYYTPKLYLHYKDLEQNFEEGA